MRSNRNPSGSVTRSVGDPSADVEAQRPEERSLAEQTMVTELNMPALPPALPMEWLDSGSWRLPSGKALAEFALQAGFLAPLLLRSDRALKSGLKCDLGQARVKQFGKGDGR
jgi:hypothetical protein